jgi:hypothetical protein
MCSGGSGAKQELRASLHHINEEAMHKLEQHSVKLQKTPAPKPIIFTVERQSRAETYRQA